uniref:GLTSCR1 domain-containing protein n=1 Tax=Panagrellus redivivus TaxID=6233 RepID=A0A7E4VKN6_PANRE
MSVTELQAHSELNPGNNPVAMDTDSDTSSTFEGINASEPVSETEAVTNDTTLEPVVEEEKKIFMRVPRRFMNKRRKEVEYYRKKFNQLAKLYVEYARETDKTRNHVLLVQSELQRLKDVKRQLCTRLAAHNDNYMDQNLEIPDNNHFDADVRQLIDDVITNAELAPPPAKKKKSEKKSNPRPRESTYEEEPEAYEAIKNILNEATTVIQQQQQEQEEMIRRREVEQHKKADAARRAKAQQRANAASITVTPLSTSSSASNPQPASVKPVQSTPSTTVTVSESTVPVTTYAAAASQPNAYVQSYPSSSQPQIQSNQTFILPTQTTQNASNSQPKLVLTPVSQPSQGAVQANYGSASNASAHVGDSHRKKSNHEHYVAPRVPPQKNVHIETFPTTNPRNPVQQQQHPQLAVQRIRVSESGSSSKPHHVVIQPNQLSQSGNNVQQAFPAPQMTNPGIRQYVKPPMVQPLPRGQAVPLTSQQAQDVLAHHRNAQGHGAPIQQGIVQGREQVKVYAMRGDQYPQREGMNMQQQQQHHQQQHHHQQQQQLTYHQQMHSEQRHYGNPAASAPIEGQRQVVQVMPPAPVPQSAPPVRQPRLREALQNAGARQLQQQQQQQHGIPLSMQHLPNVQRAPIAKSPKGSVRPQQMSQPQQQIQHQQQPQVVQLSQLNQMAPNNNVIYIDQSRYIRVAASTGNVNHQYVIPADSMPYAINAQGGYNPQPVRYIIPQSQQIPQQTAVVAQQPLPITPNPPRARKDSGRVNQTINDDNIDWSVYNEPIVKRSPTKKKDSPRKRTTAIKLDSNSDAMARISPILAKFQEEMAQSTLAQEQQQQQQLTMAARNAAKSTPTRARRRPTKAEQKAKLALQQQQQGTNPPATSGIPPVNVTAAPAPAPTAPSASGAQGNAPPASVAQNPQNPVQVAQPAPRVTVPTPQPTPEKVTVSTPAITTKASDIVPSIPTIIVTAATPEPKGRKPSDPDLNATPAPNASSSQSSNTTQS